MPYPEPNATQIPCSRASALVGRVLGWGALGALCGLILGLVNGVIHTSPELPGADWANEFRPFRLMAIMSFECVAGGFVGAGLGLGVPSVSARRRAFFFAVWGAALGVDLGWVLTRVLHVPSVEQLYGSELMWNLIPQALGALGGIATSFSGQAGEAGSPLAGSSRGSSDA
jgi:hypothetical protein